MLKCLHLENDIRSLIRRCCPFGAWNSAASQEPLRAPSSDWPAHATATTITQMVYAKASAIRRGDPLFSLRENAISNEPCVLLSRQPWGKCLVRCNPLIPACAGTPSSRNQDRGMLRSGGV